jgi:glycosyltransferase involved in cell wall biosynthesis
LQSPHDAQPHPILILPSRAVDDNSRDGSEETVNAMAAAGFAARIIVRTTERGLSSAVIRGFQEGRGQLLLCMDGDLQHPPESGTMREMATNHGAANARNIFHHHFDCHSNQKQNVGISRSRGFTVFPSIM